MRTEGGIGRFRKRETIRKCPYGRCLDKEAKAKNQLKADEIEPKIDWNNVLRVS
jgi:DNA-binding transcriptional regulator YdaS (Cro superfamily)